MATTETKSELKSGLMGCDLTVVNNSGYQMTLSSSSAAHGYFTNGPATNIKAGAQTVVSAKGTDGTATGCEVAFTYVIGDAGQTAVAWAYAVPYDGTNSFSVTANGSMAPNYTITTKPPFTPSRVSWTTNTTSIDKNTKN